MRLDGAPVVIFEPGDWVSIKQSTCGWEIDASERKVEIIPIINQWLDNALWRP